MKKLTHYLAIKSLAIVGLCFNLTSCSDAFDTSYFDKEINDTTIGIGLKIGHSTYSSRELFEEISEDLEVQPSSDGDNLVSFIYRDEIKGENNKDVINIDENESTQGSINIDFPTIPDGPYNSSTIRIPQTGFETYNSENELKTTKAELTTITLNDGNISVDITNNTGAEAEIQFIFTSLTKNDVVFKTEIKTIQKNTTLNFSSESLKDYVLDLKNGITEFNTIKVAIKAAVIVKAGDDFKTSRNFNYKINFIKSEIKYAEGDFKQNNFIVNNQNFDIDFFENIGDGIIKVQNPVLKLIAKNQYGFPVGFGVEGISAITEDGTLENISINKDNVLPEHNIVRSTDSEFTGYYGVVKAAPTQETITEIILNGENSNLEDLFNNKPSKFNLAVTAVSNPNSPDNNTNTFNIDNRLDMDVEVELPLHVSFENLTFEPEPFEIDTEDIEDIEEDVTSLDLIIFSRNTIPLSGTARLNFVDTNGNLKFSIPSSNNENIETIEAAPVDNNLESIRSLEVVNGKTVLKEGTNIIEAKKTIITLSQEQIRLLKEVTHIEAFLKFDSTKDKDAIKVKITDQVRFDIAITSDITVSLSSKEDEENTNN